MINKFENLNMIDEDINKLNALLNLPIDIKDLIYTEKIIYLLKQIKEIMPDSYYINCVVSDCLHIIYLLGEQPKRLFYMVYRSLIENCIRFLLDLHKSDDTGVFKLFNRFNTLCSEKSCTEIYNYFFSEYEICCNFTHSNIKANLNLYAVYFDIVYNKLNDSEINKLFGIFKSFLNYLLDLIILIKPDLIDKGFYRENQKLILLMPEEKYKKYKAILSKIY